MTHLSEKCIRGTLQVRENNAKSCSYLIILQKIMKKLSYSPFKTNKCGLWIALESVWCKKFKTGCRPCIKGTRAQVYFARTFLNKCCLGRTLACCWTWARCPWWSTSRRGRRSRRRQGGRAPSKFLLHCNDDPIYVFPEMKLCRLVLIIHSHVSVIDSYISTVGPPIFL